MRNRFEQAPPGGCDRETIDQPSSTAAGPPQACVHGRELFAGTQPRLTTETQTLLRFRLRAAALILLIGFGVFLVRHVIGVLTGEPLFRVLLGFHVLVVVVLSVSTARLWRRSDLFSIKKLRIAEFVVFGPPAGFFLLLQHRATLGDAGPRVMPAPLPFWLLLIFTYGMFIPNDRRRAGIVIGGLALAPALLAAGMRVAYAQGAEVMTVVGLVQHTLVLFLAAIVSAVGTDVINNLRREVFEAKQLAQYRLLKPLGGGAMGEVYLAEHRMLKRPCAIKLIHPDRAGDPHALARFEREVRATARLSHWHTVEIFDYGRTDDGTFFYIMEYLPGFSLEELLDRHAPLPAERVVHLLRQTCHALREAHEAGLIHRDIKPANIFASQRGGMYDVVKLLDFGLVKSVGELPSARLSQEGSICGTPLFMSPEQARGLGDIDARSDIYSLGAVGYALLTGRPPFDGSNAIDVMIAHVRDAVVCPSHYQTDVPADLESIILRCLAKSPGDRFPDVCSLEQALSQCAVADQWSQWHAARWWQENDQAIAAAREMSMAASA